MVGCIRIFGMVVTAGLAIIVTCQLSHGVTLDRFRGSGDLWHTFPQKVYRAHNAQAYWACVVPQLAVLAQVVFTRDYGLTHRRSPRDQS